MSFSSGVQSLPLPAVGRIQELISLRANLPVSQGPFLLFSDGTNNMAVWLENDSSRLLELERMSGKQRFKS